MIEIARTDRSLVGRWWWTLDRMLLSGLLVLVIIGIVVVFAASPPTARHLGQAEMFFVSKHVAFAALSVGLLVFCSLLAPLGVLRLAIAMLALFGVLLLLTPVSGIEIKGAHRWISAGGVMLQPSEFVKPALAVVVARLLARRERLRGFWEAAALVALVLALLLSQPDLGMTGVVAAVFSLQLFVAGLAWPWVLGLLLVGSGGMVLAYLSFSHVSERVDTFLDPTVTSYQVTRALDAVAAGGLFGRGPGEGTEKYLLPDAHTDFVFAATAEEFGIIACLLILGLFAVLCLRGFWRAHECADRFCQLAAAGLIGQFALQALINMAVNVNLLPTKGMTLPLVSYGGSSMLALGIGMGMLLALTRRHARLEIPR